MTTFFFSLSLRASEQVLRVEDPLRCWIVKLILRCEVASALLIVQLGIFTDPLYGLLAFLLLLLMGMLESCMKEGKNVSGAYAYRMSVHTQHGVSSSFASEVSVLEADRIAPTLLLPVLVRASCSVMMLVILQRIIIASSALTVSDASYLCSRWAGGETTVVETTSISDFFLWGKNLTEADIVNKVCVPEDQFSSESNWTIPITRGKLCGKELNLLPAILQSNCKAHKIDPIQYQLCLQRLPEGGCNAIFLHATLSDQTSDSWFPLMFYIFLPHVAVCLLVLLFLQVFILNHGSTFCCRCCGDGGDQEESAATLRKKIRRKATALQAQQESGSLDSLGSLFWARRSLELKLFMFACDYLMDCWLCWHYIDSMNYSFAACQGAIIILSSMLQIFRVRGHSLSQELAASWTSGMPTDIILRVLLVEKAVEAPLSLCLQYFSAFHLKDDLLAFVLLILSSMLSIHGIAEVRYISITLWDMVKQDRQPKSADPGQATDPNQSVLPKYPPGLLPRPPGLLPRPPGLLPPPPGLLPPPPGMLPPPPGMLPPPPGIPSKIGSPQKPLPQIQLDGKHINDTE